MHAIITSYCADCGLSASVVDGLCSSNRKFDYEHEGATSIPPGFAHFRIVQCKELPFRSIRRANQVEHPEEILTSKYQSIESGSGIPLISMIMTLILHFLLCEAGFSVWLREKRSFGPAALVL